MSLLRVQNLAISFGSPPHQMQAVAGVSLTLHPNQTLAIVGESGSGKSITALSILGLLPKTTAHIDSGQILYSPPPTSTSPTPPPIDLLKLNERAFAKLRGSEIAMIFQEPMTSLNPVFTIGDQILEAITLHTPGIAATNARTIAMQALERVGISNPAARLKMYPHEFSGGMRQRAMIAMALACNPRILLADEPTTALDVTVQAQVLDLIASLQQERGISVMLITHDLRIVKDRADVICAMYAGRVVEYGPATQVLASPLHPYTKALLMCTPRLETRGQTLPTVADLLQGPESMQLCIQHPSGNTFNAQAWWPHHPTPQGTPITDPVSLFEASPGRWVSCWNSPHLPSAGRTHPDVPPILGPGTTSTAGTASTVTLP